MTDTDGEVWTPGEMTRALKRVIRLLEDYPSNYVLAREYTQNNTDLRQEITRVDQGKGKEIADLREELHGRRVPWTSVGAFLLASASTLILIIQAVQP